MSVVIVGLMEKDENSHSQMQGSENHLAVMRELSEVTCIPAEIKELYGNLIKRKIMEENTYKDIETEVVEYFIKMGYGSDEILDQVEPYAKIYIEILFILKTHIYLNHYEVYDKYVRKEKGLKRVSCILVNLHSHLCKDMNSISPGSDAEEERVAIYKNVTADRRSFIERLRKKFKRRLNLIGKFFVTPLVYMILRTLFPGKNLLTHANQSSSKLQMGFSLPSGM